jgi:two-component system sensor histidine kinase/response regulator
VTAPPPEPSGPAAGNGRDRLPGQTRTVRALFEIGQRLATVTSIDEVPAALAAAIRATTGASLSVVARWNEGEHRVRFEALEGVPPELMTRVLELDASPDRYRFIRGGIEGRANVRVQPFDPDDLPVELVQALGLTAIAGAPIRVADRTWGVIAVATREGDPSIVETGVELLNGLAAIAATAIGRAEAVAALERQADLLESMVAERTLQLRQAVDELTVANTARTEFLANVSHELRTPLTAILGFTAVLLQGLDGPLTEEQRSDIETIDQSGRRLLDLIDDLIDISRIEAGRIVLEPGPVDLGLLVREAVEDVRAQAGGKGLTLRVATPPQPLILTADASRVREIVLNLLSNAVKFTPSGGIVRIDVGHDEGRARVVVEDTGIGIAVDQQAHVFDKFHRVAGPEYPGTGLGLAIAREFARLHGGDVTLESALGLGSRFTVTLPLEPAAPAPGAEEPS